MAKSKQQIIRDIEAYVARCGGAYSTWYVGIASDVRRRLFTDHKVKEQGDRWIFEQCSSSTVAREIEQYFIRQKGADGGAGDGIAGIRRDRVGPFRFRG